MIATVMLTALLASFLFTLAAYCAERALVAIGRPTRGPWVIASAAAVAVPLGQLLALAVSSREAVSTSTQALPLTTVFTVGVVERFDAATNADLEIWLTGLWMAATLVALVRLFLARRALERIARSWKWGNVAGVRAWISQTYGPAVVGLSRPEIVIPGRIADLPFEEQHLAIAHELEHIAARDQWLVRLSAFAVAIAPWNPFVWLATRRLRSAIEVDCDGRVLRKKPNVTAYASLVLNVASWPRESPAGALALGESAITQLERRLRLMTPGAPRLTPGLLFFSGALALAAYGCEVAVNVESPHAQATQTPKNEVLRLPRVVTTVSRAENPFFEFQVDKPVTQAPGSAAPQYPQILRQRGVEGEVLAQFVVDEEGRADASTFKVLESSHELFAQAVHSALPGMRYSPAEVGGKPVKQLVQEPFAFRIMK